MITSSLTRQTASGGKKQLYGAKKRIGIYAGQYYDSETGLHYNYHRYYDPKLGRYLRPDPSHSLQPAETQVPYVIPFLLGTPQEFNTFTYVENNPLNWIDALGLGSRKDIWKEGRVQLRPCDSKEKDDCREKCCDRGGMKSCNVQQVLKLTHSYDNNGIQNELLEWKDTGPPQCLCNNDDPPAFPPPFPSRSRSRGRLGGRGGGSLGGCFVKGTLVHTASGIVPIEHLEIGDMVFGHNLDTSKNELRRVVALMVAVRDDIVELYIDKDSRAPIKSSANHKYYVKTKGWARADEINVGDILITKELGERVVVETKLTILPKEIKVYNIEVQGLHNFYVGEEAVLTHNHSWKLPGIGGPCPGGRCPALN